jgi:hypothetical protein
MGKSYRWVISGQPGIGKSVYGWYLIYRIITEQPDRAIVYISDALKASFVLYPDGLVQETAIISHELVATLTDPVVIADSVIPAAYNVPTIIISSPGRLNARDNKNSLNSFQKRRYLPIPTVEEMKEMARVLYPHLDKEAVDERIAMWGCIPRHVFVEIASDEQDDLSQAIGELSLEKLKAALKNTKTIGTRDACHTVLAEYPVGQVFPGRNLSTSEWGYYSFGACQFLSDHVGALVIDAALKASTWDTQFFVDATAQISGVATLNGMFLEVIGKIWLMGGGTTKIRELAAKGRAKEPMMDITVPKLTSMQFTDVAELTSKRNTPGIFFPAKSNQACFDVIVWNPQKQLRLFINFTKNKKHGLHVTGLREVVKALGYRDDHGWPNSAVDKKHIIDFAFGVPEGVMETFGRQTYTQVASLHAFTTIISQKALLSPSKWGEVKGVVLPRNKNTVATSETTPKRSAARK